MEELLFAAGSAIRIVSCQPQAILPSSVKALETNRRQVPFGSVPLKADKATSHDDGGGAGGGNGSAPKFDGLKVPLLILSSFKRSGASSSNVSVMLLAGPLAEISDINMTLCPVGPCTRTANKDKGVNPYIPSF